MIQYDQLIYNQFLEHYSHKQTESQKYLKHYKECQLDLGECETCGYKDSVKEYEKTNKKIEHIKHILLPEIEKMVKKEIEKAVSAINDSLEQRDAYKEQPENKGNDDISKRFDVENNEQNSKRFARNREVYNSEKISCIS